jgi:hypothetical protein
MKTLRFLLGMAMVAITFSLEQCAKGDPGAPGSQGPTGLTGAPGVNGSVLLFTSNVADWMPTPVSGYNFDIAAYTDTAINANAAANGVVAVYIQSGSSWVPLPYTYPYQVGGPATQTMTYNYSAYTSGPNLALQTQNSDNTTTNLQPLAAFNVKVVVIPTAIMKQHPGLNPRDYASVMQALNRNANQ